jgi:predicted nucleic acid-binding protein
MKVLIDTNIFLDVILFRHQHYENSAKAWSLVSEKKISGYISAISINNLHYILLKQKDRTSVGELIGQLLDEFEIVPLTRSLLLEAKKIDKNDLEDMIQFVSAKRSGCDYIITRNAKDFPQEKISIVGPADFMQIISEKKEQDESI